MIPLLPPTDELAKLLEASCLGEILPEQAVRLQKLVCGDSECRAHYVLFMHMHAMVERREGQAGKHAAEALEARCSGLGKAAATVSPPLLTFFGNTIHGTIGYFSQEIPFSLLIATVVAGLALWIGSLITVSRDVQISHQPSPPVAEPSRFEKIEYVGRITGTVDCKWVNPATAPVGDNVVLGHKFALASGLMEITYDTGAKVILQGPVTYEVESPSGGFLSLGKLTARVESVKPQSANQKSEIRNHKSSLSTIHFPLFTIKTPTATVTDLGTEFGVEVSQSGACEIHVIEGRVKTVHTSTASAPGEEVILSANQAIRLDPAQSKHVVIAADPGRFKVTRTKKVRIPPLRWPLLDKTFVAWVSLANLDQQGVGVMSLVDMPEWDGIVFGELDRAKWMVGSHGFARTQKEQSEYPVETASPGQFVQIAVVYGAPNVTIYRNGQKYAEYPVLDQITFNERSIVMIGKRHPWYLAGQESKSGPSSLPTLVGAVEESRFYDVSLTQKQIAALKPNEPSPIGPVGQWTFEDGTARDSTGNFPLGELHGNAKIVDGKLILDGADSFLLVPPAIQKTKTQPASVTSIETEQAAK